MSSIPSIRVACTQCKQSFWIKLKTGIIPQAVIACPNCEFAWDLAKLDRAAVVQRSYKVDEFFARLNGLFRPKTQPPEPSEEIFREAGSSQDSVEEPMELPEIAIEALSEISEVEPISSAEPAPAELVELGATSSESLREPTSGAIARPDPPNRRPVDTNRYPAVKSDTSGERAIQEDLSVDSALAKVFQSEDEVTLLTPDAERQNESKDGFEPPKEDVTLITPPEPQEPEDISEELAEFMVDLEDETVKEGELQTRPAKPPGLPSPPKPGPPDIDAKLRESLKLPDLKKPQLKGKLDLPGLGVSRETKTASSPEKVPSSDDDEHPVLPKLDKPLERPSTGPISLSNDQEQSLEMLRIEDFSSEIAREQADDFFKSSAQVAAAATADEPGDLSDLGPKAKPPYLVIGLAAGVVFLMLVAGIYAWTLT